tara:strand:- start:1818 stop:2021 length:204 start_codon:yes stop_codon:yes gene_type:complete
MKNKLKWLLSFALIFSVVAPISAMDLDNSDGMEEVKKKKWGKKKSKKSGKNSGKKSKKGFWSWFGGK